MGPTTAEEVFIPGGLPIYTYVPRNELQLERRFRDFLRTKKFLSITGRTKSGKTVLAEKIFPRDQSVWFEGGAFDREEYFWEEICTQLELHNSTTVTESVTSGVSGEVGAEGGFGPFAKIKAKIASLFSKTDSASYTRSASFKTTALAGLRKKKIPLIIDDFHYLERGEQKSILRSLKALVFQGIPVILISIPHREFDALKSERELTGRVNQLPIPSWSLPELKKIGELGFKKLNKRISDEKNTKLSKESIGSPHLMQEFCLSLGKHAEGKEIVIDDSLFIKIADVTGKPVFDKLKRGPRQRSDRIKRELKDGTKTDIYGVVLKALAALKPGEESISYEEIRTSIKSVIESNPPQSHEITRVLEHMSKIAVDDNTSAPVLDYEKEDGVLHITDPFFSFFLKWGNIHI